MQRTAPIKGEEPASDTRERSERAREHDAKIAETSFSGSIRERIETATHHAVMVLRRSEQKGDDRAAIAALSQIQRGLTDLLELESQQVSEAGNVCPSVIIHPADLREDQLKALQRQLPGVGAWLPDNGRADSMAFNGQGGEGGDAIG